MHTFIKGKTCQTKQILQKSIIKSSASNTTVHDKYAYIEENGYTQYRQQFLPYHF